jgi:hypothetical protein
MLGITMIRISAYIVSILLMFATVGFSNVALSQTPEAEEEITEPCTPEESQIDVQADNEVTFVTGGIGICESQEMQRLAREYQLELVFVQKTPGAESYLAGIPVEIIDSKGSYMLDTVTKGPYLLAKMPKGRYSVVASFNGESKTQQVSVTQKHQRVVFVWKIDY